jgi:tetratricopeptide (TPR) repeat protein
MLKLSKIVFIPSVSALLFVCLNYNHLVTAQLYQLIVQSNQPFQKSKVSPRYTAIVAEVDKKAEQVTVKVDSSAPGSGVIIGKNGQTYYVLTAKHVVNDLNNISIIVTGGKRYSVAKNAVTKYDNYDLALIEFTSAQNYTVATLANYYIGLNDKPIVFLSGFPKDENTTSLTRKLTLGTTSSSTVAFFKMYEYFSFLEGQELLYSNLTKYGMSGGPVFDHLGRVIGINIAQENLLGRGMGIPIKMFLGIVSKNIMNQLQIASNVPPTLNRTVIDAAQNDFLPEYIPTKSSSSKEWIDYGAKLWQVGKYPDAVLAFDHAIKLDKNSAQAYYAKGLALEAQDKHQEAVVALKQAIQRRASYPEAWTFMAQVFGNLKQYSEALKAIDEAIRIKQQDPDPQIFFRRGVILSNLNRHSDAIEAFSKSNKVIQNSITYALRAVSRYSLRDFNGAVGDFNQAILLQPNNYFAYAGRGSIYGFLRGQPQQALTDFNLAIKDFQATDPNRFYAYMGRAHVLMSLGNFDAANTDYTSVINSAEAGAIISKAYIGRAWVYSNQKNFQKAIQDCSKLIQIQPMNYEAYLYRAIFLGKLPQREQMASAITDLTKAIEIKRDYDDAYRSRGVIYNFLNQHQNARQDSQKAIDLYTARINGEESNNPELYIHRAISLIVVNERDRAKQDVQKAEKLISDQGISIPPALPGLLKILVKLST